MRIRGQIGDWPVDLSIELEPAEWAQLGRRLEAAVPEAPTQSAPTTAAPVRADQGHWLAACELLREAGELSGPALLERLEGLAGSVSAGKRLLVRMRHSADVQVHNGGDAPVYRWVG